MTYSLLISGAINRKERMAIDNGMDVGAVGSDFGTAKR